MKYLIVGLIVIIIAASGYFVLKANISNEIENPLSNVEVEQREKPLEKYKYETLAKTKFEPSEITLGDVLIDNEHLSSQIYFFEVEGKRVSGLINIPKVVGKLPVIILLRGYVDQEIYQTGIGTQRIGEVLAGSGYITLAPDFLGYGQSDNPSEFPIEERLQTYTTTLTLLSSVDRLNTTFSKNNINTTVDVGKVGIWGHSNGGQIAISALEISGMEYPTVLWAPVTKSFPYSILYYTDEFDDRGKMLRAVLAKFEEDYDVENYNLANYFDKINTPIQVHQGTADDAVPGDWSDEFVQEMEELDKDIEYFTYVGADHNLQPNSWNMAVARTVDFFDKLLKNN